MLSSCCPGTFTYPLVPPRSGSFDVIVDDVFLDAKVESELIELDADSSKYRFPGGAAAQVALYTPHWHHFAIIRRILLRMRSWQNYIFLEGH